jgi:hypothetical protein
MFLYIIELQYSSCYSYFMVVSSALGRGTGCCGALVLNKGVAVLGFTSSICRMCRRSMGLIHRRIVILVAMVVVVGLGMGDVSLIPAQADPGNRSVLEEHSTSVEVVPLVDNDVVPPIPDYWKESGRPYQC